MKREIYELHIIPVHDSFRVLCFFTCGREIVMPNCFRKTKLETPIKKSKLAEKRLREFKMSNV